MGCKRRVRCEGFPEPDEGMPHVAFCRRCADKTLKRAGLAPLPEGVRGMLVPLTCPTWCVSQTAKDTHALYEARAAVVSFDRRALGALMSPWGADTGSGVPVYAVGSYYYGGHVYPDRAMVERAIATVEADVPRAEAGAHGWTKDDAAELRAIARGLRHFLALDYRGATS
jgi:hypothetical protein